jgi:adenylate cyclase
LALVSPAQIRIGLNSGPCHAGIIGERRFLYDLWGDTVNVASRMEAAGEPNASLITNEVRARLVGSYDLQSLGQKNIKGRGLMNTWLLTRQALQSLRLAQILPRHRRGLLRSLS